MTIKEMKIYSIIILLVSCLVNVRYIEAQITIDDSISPPGVIIGEVSTEWKGFLEIPIWTLTNISLVDETYFILPENQNKFRFGVTCKAKNSGGFDECYSVTLKVEQEKIPFSGDWRFVCKNTETFICKAKSIDKRYFLSLPVLQKAPEVRYRITILSKSAVEARPTKKVTFVTLKCSTKYQYFYTVIPFLPITILHDPNGDRSYTELTSKAKIKHLFRFAFAMPHIPVRIEKTMQEDITFTSMEGKLLVKGYGTNTLALIFQPSRNICSEKASDTPELIGPGYGDMYVIAKNIPIKIMHSQVNDEISVFFNVVSSQEAGIDKEFDIILIPAGYLRTEEKGSVVFGKYRKWGITDTFREELIKLNIGWDNTISQQEIKDTILIGKVYLNDKEYKHKKWKQPLLTPTKFNIDIPLDARIQESISLKQPLLEVVMNPEDISGLYGIQPRRIKICLADANCRQEPGDFFTYQMYVDRRFGTVFFQTIDDKSKPISRSSLHYRSISSSPNEYWTGSWQGNIIAEVYIGHPVEGKVQDTGIQVTQEVVFEEQGKHISVIEEPGQYIFRGMTPGEHVITAKAEGFLEASKKVYVTPLKSAYIKFLLVPEQPFVYGVVTDATSGEGIPESKIQVITDKNVIKEIDTDPKGNYQIDKLKYGVEYNVISIAKGYDKRRKIVSFTPDQKVVRLDFLLTKSPPPVIAVKPTKKITPPEISKPTLKMPEILPEAPPPLPEKEIQLKALAKIKKEKGIIVKEREEEIKIEITQEAVNFASGSDVIPHEAYDVLSKLADILKAYPDCKVIIEGHTDNVPLGPSLRRKYKDNKGLSLARAESVKRFLIEREGVPIKNLVAVGYGATRPIASNKTKEGRARNRRVEIIIKKPEKPVTVPPPVITPAPTVKKEVPVPKIEKPEKKVAKLPEKAIVRVQPLVPPPKIPEVPKEKEITPPKVSEKKPEIAVVAPPVVKPEVVEKVPEVKKIEEEKPPMVVYKPPEKERRVPPPVIIPMPKVYTKLTNGGFDEGMRAWSIRKEGRGQIYVGIAKDSAMHPTTLELRRKKSKKNMGEAAVVQKLNIRLHEYTVAKLKADVKIMSASLSGDGKAGGDYPICFELKYIGTDGKPYIFKHGFLYRGKIHYPELGERIKRNRWFSYTSPNLMELSPRPVKITELKISARGWDFTSRVDNVQLQLATLPVEIPEVIRKVEEKIPIPEKKVTRKPEVIPVYTQLTNGGFEHGMKYWQTITHGFGDIKAHVIKDDREHPHCLEMVRRNSKSTGGGISVFQMLDISVVRYNLCKLHGEFKVVDSSLAGDRLRGGVYPVCLEIEYVDITGKPYLFRHGFLTKGRVYYPEFGEKIKRNRWIVYSTPNLMELSPKPAKITCVRLEGYGWDFVSRVDNLRFELSTKPVEKPVIVTPKPKIPPEEEIRPSKPVRIWEEKKPIKVEKRRKPKSWIMEEDEALRRFKDMETAGMARLAESLVIDPKGLEELSILLISPSLSPKQAARIIYKLYQVQGADAVNKVLKMIGKINPDKTARIKRLLSK